MFHLQMIYDVLQSMVIFHATLDYQRVSPWILWEGSNSFNPILMCNWAIGHMLAQSGSPPGIWWSNQRNVKAIIIFLVHDSSGGLGAKYLKAIMNQIQSEPFFGAEILLHASWFKSNDPVNWSNHREIPWIPWILHPTPALDPFKALKACPKRAALAVAWTRWSPWCIEGRNKNNTFCWFNSYGTWFIQLHFGSSTCSNGDFSVLRWTNLGHLIYPWCMEV